MHQNEIFEIALSHQTNKFNINLCTPEKRLWPEKMVAMRSLSGETTYGRRKWLQYGLCPEKVGFHRTKRCLKVGGLQAVPKGCAIGKHKRRPPVCHQEQRQPYARRAVA